MVQFTRHILTLTTKIIMGGGGGWGRKLKKQVQRGIKSRFKVGGRGGSPYGDFVSDIDVSSSTMRFFEPA